MALKKSVKITSIRERWSISQVILPSSSQLIPDRWSLLLILSEIDNTCRLHITKEMSLVHGASHRPEAGRLWLHSIVDFYTHLQEASFFLAGVPELIHSIDGLEESPQDQMTLLSEIPLQSNARARFTRQAPKEKGQLMCKLGKRKCGLGLNCWGEP